METLNLTTNNKPIAKITGDYIKYFNPDGSINKQHSVGFYYPNAENILKNDGYLVIRL